MPGARVAAVVAALLVSAWPLAAVAISAVGQGEVVVPFVQEPATRFVQR